jgi:hypothetical protein
VPRSSEHSPLLFDVSLNDLGVVERKSQRVEDFGGPQLRVALQDGFDLHAVAKERINAAHWHTRTINIRATAENGGFNANVGMRDEYYRKRQGETSHRVF